MFFVRVWTRRDGERLAIPPAVAPTTSPSRQRFPGLLHVAERASERRFRHTVTGHNLGLDLSDLCLGSLSDVLHLGGLQRRDDILLWSETNYRFLKRQTQRDPKLWVSLDDAKTTSTASLAKGKGN